LAQDVEYRGKYRVYIVLKDGKSLINTGGIMKPRKIKDKIYWMGSVDWDRRLFDSLVPLPDGTSYRKYSCTALSA